MIGLQLVRASTHPSPGCLRRGISGVLHVSGNVKPTKCLVCARSMGTAKVFALTSEVSTSQEEAFRILMVAGGTGGHIYPAIAIADEIKNLNKTAQVQFAGTKDRMEWSAVPQAGYELSVVPAVAIRRPFYSLQNLLVPAKLLIAMFACWKLLNRIRPHVVVGTGGYVSGPLCLAAAISGFPVVIQEQNAYAGITNRLLGKIAQTIFVAFWAATAYFPKDRCMLYGNPTRVELRQYVSAAVARRYFFPLDERRIADHGHYSEKRKKKEMVLILGGSLGALAINEAVADMAVKSLEENSERHIIWQTGPKYYEEMVQRVGQTHPRLAIYPYVSAMHMAYAAADLVVARAGAITCSELLVTGKPSILIPSRNVAEDHQTKNAEAMAEGGSARVLSESALSSSSLASMIDELLGDDVLLTDMMEKALRAATPDASNQIAQHIIRLANKRVSGVMA
ncbi:UDP-N-acetylglucosamine--N-acetylmuramyl-(pentapeptide) pyrophosphoryl-undecaprenol N-acetylglucosamine transferase [Marchantia polymorpha subsp. ruderalis]